MTNLVYNFYNKLTYLRSELIVDSHLSGLSLELYSTNHRTIYNNFLPAPQRYLLSTHKTRRQYE